MDKITKVKRLDKALFVCAAVAPLAVVLGGAVGVVATLAVFAGLFIVRGVIL